MISDFKDKILLGWREWVSLPGIGIPAIKAKVDTGARTSALHAYQLETFVENGKDKVRFKIHPLQKRTDIYLECVADIFDQRVVTDSGGHRELRYVIKNSILIGDYEFDAEITLTDRDTMRFRMLLGRTFLKNKFIVDSASSYMQSSKPESLYGIPNKRSKK